jgi:formylglycine-generating enzyme required for sulfatase activity
VLAQPITQTTWIADMVLIPAGPFLMGSNVRDDENPVTEVWVDAFAIDRTPVTNGQFRAFWESGMYDDSAAPCWTGLQEGFRWIHKEEMRRVPRYWYDAQWNAPQQPIVGVTWYEALAYARWAGKRLPTEAEWEKAARGEDGRQYPWGDTFDYKCCNVAKSGIKGTSPVGHFSPLGDSPYGVSDMAGNIWEWTSSLYELYPYRADDGREDLREDAGRRVLRGGSWQSRFTDHTRCANRYAANPNFGFVTTGFRCAKSL